MVSRARPKGVCSAPFGLCLFIVALGPTSIGRQDVAALIARQPEVAAHWRQHIRASAFGTIHASLFSFSRPIGTSMPRPLSYQLANLDPRVLSLGAWDEPAEADGPLLQYPSVNRVGKSDREPVAPPPKPQSEAEPAKPDETPAPAALRQPTDETATALKLPDTPEITGDDFPDPVDVIVGDAPSFPSPEPLAPVTQTARLYFGQNPLGDAPAEIEKWAPGEEPTIISPSEPDRSEVKQSALAPSAQEQTDSKGGETIAPKGEVTGEGKHPLTPAERLNLEGSARTKAEKCLADAVYFEARGEPVRGQIAVAQVVMNRVFSGYYPHSVCATVYQNKHRRFACQFTFACDGIPDVVTEPNAWVRATRIASDVLDGKYWVPEVNRATHYHAYWVRPSWVREMKRLYKVGVHTFYRPRAWGDGSDAPSWGSAEATNEAIAKL
jgi:spore germination cell wall hydrolase CwlJ-like protein